MTRGVIPGEVKVEVVVEVADESRERGKGNETETDKDDAKPRKECEGQRRDSHSSGASHHVDMKNTRREASHHGQMVS